MAKMNRQAILMSTAHAPILFYRVGLQYLRMKRSAKKARGRFYKELISGGVPPQEAKDLADQYVSAISVRSFMEVMRSTSMSAWL